MKENFFSKTWQIVTIVVICFGGLFYYTKQQSPVVEDVLSIAENSHYVGCARVTLEFDYCRELSKQYREDLAKRAGIK